MEAAAPWRLQIASFYEQWELHLAPGVLPASLSPLLATETIDHLRTLMLAPLAARRVTLTDVTAHKLIPGQTIRIHNDYLADGETHRLLVQLNRGWEDAQGGLLMLFNSACPEDVRRILRPVHRSSVAFPISPRSFHAVSKIRCGERYTLVYSFKAEPAV
jgi:Rps23 Pro-64 3,4-dihydroxylase Tpa1-like proline 4-hydroxylase